MRPAHKHNLIQTYFPSKYLFPNIDALFDSHLFWYQYIQYIFLIFVLIFNYDIWTFL